MSTKPKSTKKGTKEEGASGAFAKLKQRMAALDKSIEDIEEEEKHKLTKSGNKKPTKRKIRDIEELSDGKNSIMIQFNNLCI